MTRKKGGHLQEHSADVSFDETSTTAAMQKSTMHVHLICRKQVQSSDQIHHM